MLYQDKTTDVKNNFQKILVYTFIYNYYYININDPMATNSLLLACIVAQALDENISYEKYVLWNVVSAP